MRRREVIAAIGTAAAWPLRARAQQVSQLRRLGVLVTTGQSDPEWNAERTAFLEAMQSLGWTDGANVRIDYRFAAGDRGPPRGFRQGAGGLEAGRAPRQEHDRG